MKITELIKRERQLVALYQNCRNNELDTTFGVNAQFFLDEYLKFIKIDDMYRGTSNAKIVERLYFTKQRINIEEVCDKCFVDERTLYRYRRKYIKLFDTITLFCEEMYLVDKSCPIK